MPHRSKPRSAAFALIAAAFSIHFLIRGEAQRQAFEVASVKPNTSGERRASIQMNLPDSFTATNQTLQSLISLMYQVPLYRMSGGPGWLATERFDIATKAGRRITVDEKWQMLRTLLEDRFKLKTHRETHDARVYALIVARSDRKLGPGLKPSALDCAEIVAERERAGVAAPPPTAAYAPVECGAMSGPGGYNGHGIQIGAFVITLSAIMRETIVDDTGLTGWWDLHVTGNLMGDNGGRRGGPAPDTPSVFTSLQEQLGLKLEPRRGPVETFVIDSVERPTSD